MRRVALGDRAAFRTLLERWEGAAKRYAYRFFGDYHAAEDAAQEAFVRVYRSAVRYEPTAKFSTYFYTVLGNVCRDRLRAERRRTARGAPGGRGTGGFADPAFEIDEHVAGDPALEPDRHADTEESRAAVRLAVASLPEKLREAVSLREFEGLAYTEIAAAMGANLGEVKTWIHRGRKALAPKLRRWAAQEETP